MTVLMMTWRWETRQEKERNDADDDVGLHISGKDKWKLKREVQDGRTDGRMNGWMNGWTDARRVLQVRFRSNQTPDGSLFSFTLPLVRFSLRQPTVAAATAVATRVVTGGALPRQRHTLRTELGFRT